MSRILPVTRERRQGPRPHAYGLNKNQARLLHDEISGQNLSYAEIVKRATDIAEGK